MHVNNSDGKWVNLPRPAPPHCGSSFKWVGAGQPVLVIWVEYANLPRPAIGWQVSGLARRKIENKEIFFI